MRSALPIDGKGPINAKANAHRAGRAGRYRAKQVSQPVADRLKAIDAMVPIGRGQRELIIGDRQTGKTAVAIDTIINQKGTGAKLRLRCFGQKQSSYAQVVGNLEEQRRHRPHDHRRRVLPRRRSPCSTSYPLLGVVAMAEDFMDNGEDALIVYELIRPSRRWRP